MRPIRRLILTTLGLLCGCEFLWGDTEITDFDADGFDEEVDCDDADPAIHPEHGENCDGVDQDCDGVIDDGWDQDGDGSTPCAVPADCDDTDPLRAPGLFESCDGVDTDCDGVIDEDCGPDGDGDGWNTGSDCNDADSNIHPEATEYCNGRDDDCDTMVDEGFDADADGVSGCGSGGDCDDADPTVHPGQPETCDGRDEDCDAQVDENFDADQDGSSTCDSPPDCNDFQPLVHPGHGELCDGMDNDCDGSIDENATGDGDGDGISACSGDCDDGNAAIHPGAPDAPGPPDRDCSGGADLRWSGSAGAAWLAPTGTGTAGRFGDRMVTGDWNGDGLGDVAVSSTTWDNGKGRVSLLLGSSWSVLSPPATWTAVAWITGTTAEAYLGWSIDFGDVNGDGYDDLLVGEPELNTVAPPNGSVRIWFGGPLLTSGEWPVASADVTISGALPTEQCGTSVAAVGDLNADGREDLAFGCPWYPNGSVLSGRTVFFFGRATWAAAYDADDGSASVHGTAADLYSGGAIRGLGDHNGDGFDDVIIGSPSWGGGDGRVGLWTGGPAGWSMGMSFDAADRRWEGVQSEGLGTWLGSGDVNDDGRGDLLFSAPGLYSGAGAIGVVFGTAAMGTQGSIWDQVYLWIRGETPLEDLDRAVVSDLDGDGVNELILGGGGWDGPAGGDQGRVSILYGPNGALTGMQQLNSADAHILGAAQGDGFGGELAAGFDLSGDGDLDFVVAAPYQDGGGPNGGRIYVVTGW